MKSPASILQTKYYDAINGTLANSVKIYDHVPTSETGNYVYFSGYTETDASNKNDFRVIVTKTLVIVTKFAGDFGGKKTMYDIGNEIIQLIRKLGTSNQLDLSPDHLMISTTVDSTSEQVTKTDTGMNYTYRITFRHIIEEN